MGVPVTCVVATCVRGNGPRKADEWASGRRCGSNFSRLGVKFQSEGGLVGVCDRAQAAKFKNFCQSFPSFQVLLRAGGLNPAG
jgi:hypothetical protein